MTNNEIKISKTAIGYVEAINKMMGLVSQHEEYKYFCNDMGKTSLEAYLSNLSCCISNSASGIRPSNLRARKKAIADGIDLMELVHGANQLTDEEKEAVQLFLPFRFSFNK
jgi:hypothetical protein